MNKTVTALIVKFVMTFAAAWVAVTLVADQEWTWALLAAFLGTVVNYLLGDLFILPNYGNITASIADGILAAGLLFLLDLMSADLRLTATAYLTFGLLVAAGEYFFHRYLIDAGIVEEKRART